MKKYVYPTIAEPRDNTARKFTPDKKSVPYFEARFAFTDRSVL